jgi:hypothetical protein
MERETGIEPVTSSLGSWRSTAELLPLRRERIRLSPRGTGLNNTAYGSSDDPGDRQGAVATWSPLFFKDPAEGGLSGERELKTVERACQDQPNCE